LSQLAARPAGALERLSGLSYKHPELLLMMDYDGTMAPIKETPGLAKAGLGLLKAVKRAARQPWLTLAVVSGRDIDDLRNMLYVEGIYLVGCHGAEYAYPNGESYTVIDPVGLEPVLNRIAQLGQECIGSWPGIFLEHKKTAVAMHYRLAEPSAALQVLTEFSAAVRKLLQENDLELLPGKKVLEIRSRSVNKGQVVQRLMGLHPQHYPIYIGDDLTDEDGFKAIRNRGTGVLVSEVDKLTSASLRLREPKEVLKLLKILSTRCEY